MSENTKVFLWDRLEIHKKMLGNYMERNMWKFQHNKEIDVPKRGGGAVGADINWNNTIQKREQ